MRKRGDSTLEAQRPLEPVRVHQLGVAEQLAAWAVGDDSSGVEQDGPGAELQDHLEVVSGDQLGAGEAVNEPDEPPPTAGVEVGRGFVEHEHRWPARQHAG